MTTTLRRRAATGLCAIVMIASMALVSLAIPAEP